MPSFSMPSGRSAARVPGARVGNSLTDFHGRPLTQSGTGGNALMNAGAAPAPTGGNLLTGAPALPSVSAMPAPQPAPMPPPGQERHVAVGKMLGAENLPDHELSARMDRSVFVQSALRKLLQQPTIDHGDVAQALADGIKHGGIPAADAPAILASIPQDPAKLRQAVEGLNSAATHAAVHIAGEQQRRKSKS